jgi:hypothetical protein
VWNKSLLDGPIPSFQFLGMSEETTDEDGNTVPSQPIFGDQLPAYNLNIAAQIYTDALEPYRIQPAVPKRVFAGAIEDTVFLTFADEAEAIEALGDYWTEPDA